MAGRPARDESELKERAWDLFCRLLYSPAMQGKTPEYVLDQSVKHSELFLSRFGCNKNMKSEAA